MVGGVGSLPVDQRDGRKSRSVGAIDRINRWARFVAAPVFGIALCEAIIEIQHNPPVDFTLYRAQAAAWLHGASFYPASQVAHQFEVRAGDILYPPLMIPIFVLATVLPEVVWVGVPLAITAIALVALRPAPWSWPLIAMCLAFPTTPLLISVGNPIVWAVGALALGTAWRPAAAFVALWTPSLAPFALIGIRDRGWWATGILGGLAMLMVLPLTSDWVASVVHASGPRSGILYSWPDVPLMVAPIIALSARSTRRVRVSWRPAVRWRWRRGSRSEGVERSANDR